MSKKSILIILFLLLLSVGGITLYNTFAYDPEVSKLKESNADYNIIYSLKENSDKYITVPAKQEKYVDIELNNTYTATIKYGMYYLFVNPKEGNNNVSITLSEDSTNPVEDIIKPSETKIVEIKINNESDDNIDLVVGALIGFENGEISDLIKNGEVLIK